MELYFLSISLMFLAVVLLIQAQKQKTAAIINHRKNHKRKGNSEMKELAQKFIGKDCIIYTIASSTDTIKGIVTEVTESGMLVEYGGNFQAVNLEYVTRICERSRKKNGKKKTACE